MCGTRAARRCGNCGGALEAEFRFCPQCGQAVDLATAVAPAASSQAPAASPVSASFAGSPFALHATPPPTPATIAAGATAAPADGERKQVTVLFCDLVGSTSIAERLDPEEYRELIDRYLERVFPEVYRYGGIVNTLVGDGLMALFGAPVAHEDDPRRALRAALAIRDTLANLADTIRSESGIELKVRIGIHTGPVVVGTVGNSFKMDYTAIGDTTNLAARLQTAAQPGSILMSDATYRLVRGLFVVEPTGPLDVRGKSEPVVAYEVLARAAGTSPMTIARERGLTPLVGREVELARLEDAFRRVSRDALGLVAVVGDAGSGKSRLLYELKHRLEGDGVVFFEGRCSSINQMVPYHPMLSMLRHFFELGPDDSREVAQQRFKAKFGDKARHVGLTYPILTRLLSMPAGSQVEVPPEGFARELSDGITELVLGEQGPVIVTLEDLHWIDDASRDLLGTLLKRLADAPVLVVVTHRPDGEPKWRVPARRRDDPAEPPLGRRGDRDPACRGRRTAAGRARRHARPKGGGQSVLCGGARPHARRGQPPRPQRDRPRARAAARRGADPGDDPRGRRGAARSPRRRREARRAGGRGARSPVQPDASDRAARGRGRRRRGGARRARPAGHPPPEGRARRRRAPLR
jgi:class 3 adenylate cyclase